ncbi:MAG: S-methyl-5-thioribose-1-phosphate isomerase, partial [Spirochaetes bacterium]|nr:S-methyl-5-thioribose-1-phosphate isomerase [Spirochaetota bacterium]
MTAWELSQNGVPNTVICDNTGGHLMQNGLVDVVIVGTDRTVRNGDTANKIGTYLKALAAHDNDVPFFIALPSPSFDASLASGVGVIPIEERDPAEVLCLRGRALAAAAGVQAASDPGLQTIELFAPGTKAANYGFDVTPARLITGYITEHGIFDAAGLADGLAAAATGADHGR